MPEPKIPVPRTSAAAAGGDPGHQRAADTIRQAEALLVTAGAGMGVDSGLPDFRGDEGFWQAYPPFARLGLSFYDLANPSWFDRDPELAWGFYGHRQNLYRDTLPHSGFEHLRRWGESLPAGAFVFTSNVDGQFAAAGFDASRIVECHGSLLHLQCSRPCGGKIWSAPDESIDVDPETIRAHPPLPACPDCGAVARPNVLMFGDWSWAASRTGAQERRLEAWLASLRGRRVVIVELGAGTAVPTVRLTSERVAARLAGTLVRINPREPEVPRGQIGLAAGARETLTRISGLL